jgi:hypothetical protein
MNVFKIIGILFFTIVFSAHSFSQYRESYYENAITYEFGVGAGMMNCITDLGGANTDNPNYFNEIRKENNRLSKNLYAEVMYHNMLAARLEGSLGQVTSTDSTITGKSNNLISKRVRNLSFRSKIAEISLMLEFHPLHLINFDEISYLSPYVVGGIGWYHFNPQAGLNGKWIDLQPLHTEGQGFPEYPDRKPYRLSQFNLPIGIGLRYEVSDAINLRLEFVHRILYTDYLDDASTKKYIDPSLFVKYLSPSDAANAKMLYNRSKDGTIPAFRGHFQNNDAYMSLTLKVGVVLGRESTGNNDGTRHLKWRF